MNIVDLLAEKPLSRQKLLRARRILTDQLVHCAPARGIWHVRQDTHGYWTEIWQQPPGPRGRSSLIAGFSNAEGGPELAEAYSLLDPRTTLHLVNAALRNFDGQSEG